MERDKGRGGWRTRPLKACATWYSGGTPNRGTPSFWGGSIPWITAKSLTGLFIVRGMSLKSEFRMGIATRPVTFNQDLKALVAADDVVPAFLAYAIKARTRDILNMVGEAGHGTGVLPTDRIGSLPIDLPPVCEQQAIARVLGELDERIEVNWQLRTTLEELGRTLFKSWFIDFEGSKGHLSRSWARRPLGEWVDALSGGTPSKANTAFWGGELPWISPKVMTDIHADEADAFVTPATIGNGTRLAPKGSTLVMVRGMGLHQRVRVSQARREVTFNQDVKALVPRGIEPSLLLFAMLDAQAELLGRVESSGHGTGVLPTEILLSHSIAMPPRAVQMEMAKPFDLINDRIALAREESRTLAELRDLLLPKLLSGELRIRDAERTIEAVA